jgi:hypothetical protein
MDIRDYFKNKTVAVVGNAESLFGTQYGSEINDHDVVIRINTPAIFYDDLSPRYSHGTRLDVWVMWDSLKFRTNKVKNSRLDSFLYSNRYQLLDLNMSDRTDGFKWNDEYVDIDKNRILKETGNPSSGLILLSILNELDTSAINVYGFDFKKTPTFSDQNHCVDENRFDSFYRHNYKFEEQYAKQKFFSQNRFTLKEI